MTLASTEAFDFLSRRASYPAKLMQGPAPDRAALERILTAALRVPDHGKLEPWRIVVLGRARLDGLADLAVERAAALGLDGEQAGKGRGQFARSQLAVAVIGSPKAVVKVPQIEQVLSAGALCVNIVNAATAAGWAACWLSGWPAHDTGFCAAGLGVAEGEFVAGFIHFGTQTTALADRPRPDLARVVDWG